MLNCLIINPLFSIIPLILILFLSFLPSPCSVLVIKINILHIFYFVHWFSKLWSWKYLCRLLLKLLTFFNYSISSKYNWTRAIRSIWFLWTIRMFWFCIISWSFSWWVWISKLWKLFFRIGSRTLIVLFFRLRMISFHW